MIKDVDGNKYKIVKTDEPSYLDKNGIYRFFIKRDILEALIKDSKLDSVQKEYLIKNLNEENYEIESKDFYCVYVGQTTKGFENRVIKNHIKGSGGSTMRNSLKALGFDNNKLKGLFQNENNYIFKIENIADNKIDFEELKAINSNGFHLLNLENNKHYFEKDKDTLIEILLKIKLLRKSLNQVNTTLKAPKNSTKPKTTKP